MIRGITLTEDKKLTVAHAEGDVALISARYGVNRDGQLREIGVFGGKAAAALRPQALEFRLKKQPIKEEDAATGCSWGGENR